jgi:UDP-N-acetylglucosamine--N-acetylmuramyl-(pentapeptide) pyrophosphoryl-undecaprenol N-acetylglucosamine transferase
VPAIAVADALRAEGAEVSFLGTRERAEAELVPAARLRDRFLRVSGLDRRNPLKAAVAAWRAIGATRATRRLLAEPSGRRCGWRGVRSRTGGPRRGQDGVPLVLTEADSHLGLANRLLAPRASRVCLSFPIPGRDGRPYVVTGRPVPRAVLEATRPSPGVASGSRSQPTA